MNKFIVPRFPVPVNLVAIPVVVTKRVLGMAIKVLAIKECNGTLDFWLIHAAGPKK